MSCCTAPFMSATSAPEKRSTRADSPGAPKPPSKTEAKEETKEKGSLISPKKVVMVAVLGAVAFAAYRYLGTKFSVKEGLEQAVEFVENQGNAAVYWYMLFTFVGVVCLIPTTPMEIAGGFLFNNKYGLLIYVFTGVAKLCANVVSVLLARHVFKDWVHRTIVQKSELLSMVASAVKEEPWKMAFLVRGSMAPLFVKNYGLGVMDIGYLPNACCSLIFTNFYAAQNIYMGSTMSNLKEAFAPKKAGTAGPSDWKSTAKSLMPIVFNVLLVVFLVKALKSQFKKQREQLEAKLKDSNEKKAK